MYRLIWILFLTAIVCTCKCDLEISTPNQSSANQTNPDDQSLPDYADQTENNPEEDLYDGRIENDPSSNDNPNLELLSNLAESDEIIDQSASTNIESPADNNNNNNNNTEISNLVNNNPALQAHIEHLKKTNPQLLKYASSNEKQFFDTIFKNFINSQNNQTSQKSGEKYKELLPKSDPIPEDNSKYKEKIYTIGDLRKFYEQTQSEGSRQPDRNSNYYNPNHNYHFSPEDEWKPLINTKSDHPRANQYYDSDGSFEPVGPSTRVDTYIANDIPSSLSNFYVASGQNPFHAYESNQNKINNQQETIKQEGQIPNVISAKEIVTISNSKGKDSSGHNNNKMIQDSKMPNHVAYKESGYVPASEHDDRFHQYLTCCEQLFKNYGNKDYVHEEVYLLPKGEEYPLIQHHIRRPGYQNIHHHSTQGKPVSYFRGYPIVTHEDKESLHREPFVVKHGGVECSEDNHHHHRHPQPLYGHPGHYMPSYHSTTHVRPHSIFHSPSATFLLKKKLALLGKRYLLG